MKTVATTFLLLLASAASAGPLLRPAGPAGPREQPLALDAARLADLRGRRSAVLEDFPLGRDGTATLALHRVEPFTKDLRIEVDTPAGVETLPRPDAVYFGGTVVGETRSLVLLVAAPDAVRGFVVRGDATYPFGPDRQGALRSYALHDLQAGDMPLASDFCTNDLHPDRVRTIPLPAAMLGAPSAPTHSTTMLEGQVAIDTDTELVGQFGSLGAATNYLTSLFAAANVIYERDVQLHLTLNYLRLRASSDPWTSADTADQLDELQAHWLNGSNGMPNAANDIVHLVSGKGPSGGIAYVTAACNATYHFGVSQVNAAFDVSDPYGIWDVLVFTHEIGHNMGSQHTHCYSPPVDQCFNGEGGCYAGSTSLPPGGGTIMSYCHLLPGGLSNVDLLFGSTVSATIRDFAESVGCLSVAAVCGDGTTDPGEQCDDGNTTNGDGCSSVCEVEGACGDGTVGAGEQCDDGNTTAGDGCDATCQLETVCGNGVVEGVEQCDDGNTINGDGCSYKCRLESVCGNAVLEGFEQCDDGNTSGGDGCSVGCRFEQCGNHYVDVGEQCDDGNGVSGDGCSATCADEVLCGDGSLDPGEACDDGNLAGGDGCSPTCMAEPCQIVVPHQTAWAPVRLVTTPGAFALRGRFGVPSDALDLEEVAASGLRLLVDGATGTRAIDVTVPGGDGWAVSATRVRYRDPSGAVSGVRSIVLRARGDGVTTVNLKIASHGGPVPDANDAPPTVTVLLGDESAGEVGACGRFAFAGNGCVKRGKKLTCR
jgi:cysteine-rich repeat protein